MEAKEESPADARRRFLRKVALAGIVGASAVAAQSAFRLPPEAVGATDQLVKIDTQDSTADFLNNKIATGIGLSKSILNPGGNEQLNLAATNSSLVVPASQTIWRDATTTYRKDGTSGVVTSYTNSITRDLDAIQGAVNALGTSGGVIMIRSGTYSVSGAIDLTGKYNTAIEGEALSFGALTAPKNGGTVLKIANSANSPAIKCKPASTDYYFITLRNLVINGNAANQTVATPLVDFQNVWWCTFENLTLTQGKGDGIKCYGCRWIRILHCNIGMETTSLPNLDISGSGILLDGAQPFWVSGNAIELCSVGITLQNSGAMGIEDGEISRNLIVRNGGHGIYLNASVNNTFHLLKIQGNSVNENGGHGIYTHGAGGEIAFIEYLGNHVIDNGFGSGSTNYSGFLFDGNYAALNLDTNMALVRITPQTQAYGMNFAAAPSGPIRVSNNYLNNGALGSINGVPNFPDGSLVFNNYPYGVSGAANQQVGPSSWTYRNDRSVIEAVYISGGTVSEVIKNGITIFRQSNVTVLLWPKETVTITYSSMPTFTRDDKG